MDMRRASPGPVGDEAERVPGRVREDVEGLLLVVGAVEPQLRPEAQRHVLVPLERRDVLDEVVDVQLLGHTVVRPGARDVLRLLLEGELAGAVRPGEDEPVGIIGAAVARRLVTRAVDQAEQLPVELGELPRASAVEDGVDVCRVRLHVPHARTVPLGNVDPWTC